MTFKPSGDRVLINPEQTKTKSGLRLLGVGQSPYLTGTVLAVGPESGFEVGDRVAYSKSKSITLSGNGLSGVLIDGPYILGTLEDKSRGDQAEKALEEAYQKASALLDEEYEKLLAEQAAEAEVTPLDTKHPIKSEVRDVVKNPLRDEEDKIDYLSRTKDGVVMDPIQRDFLIPSLMGP